ncbi:ABC transporter ATP-binding protein [Robertmurraya andreesenii]|uniref:Peptide/nickel transport system ATP-binding protein/oligopeptide transport system ATP-binding protein n=1 Tax=Anoxybacillus andreesenii TaxID=1325932 RepID=A0ABT9UZ98_9BACL|nr:dipeptide ABC transporter ATP-binding protein [Robertmurraya andreesenii]MDQ0154025.1 peptide/nickel transport system ATP-binding protein/oligopeptide transport system ATP-binding protein [Robertmurraya andreesenii]
MAEQANEPLLDVRNLQKFFPVTGQLGRIGGVKGQVKAVNDVSFQLFEGETYGLVGESGCGKSTTGRTLLRLTEPTGGKTIYKNQDIFQASKKELRSLRKDLQMVFQDPYSSLNPRKRIGQTLEEPLVIHSLGSKEERRERVFDILNKVGLGVEHYYRYPHEFSGGQRQRLGLARALVMNPKVVIYDEPVSALDVSIQSQVINLLKKLQDDLKLTYLFITHDISVVRHISDRIGVMYLGKIVEEAPTDSLFASPLHPYTKALFSAVPGANREHKKERIVLKGEIPSPLNPPSGCMFHTRCPFAMDICKKEVPVKKEMESKHFVACHLY